MAPSSSGAGPSTQRRVPPGQTPAQLEAARKKQEALLKAAELKQMLNNLEKVDDDGRRTSLLDTLCSKEDILNLPLHPNPPGIKNGELSVDLLKHQVCLFPDSVASESHENLHRQ
jgi:SWI/SNF-related matrix-associated actin-dependent regulator of chromatin subfamily A3